VLEVSTMGPQFLPASTSGDPSAWEQAIYGFRMRGKRRVAALRPARADERYWSVANESRNARAEAAATWSAVPLTEIEYSRLLITTRRNS
jgi:hypothetical protein